MVQSGNLILDGVTFALDDCSDTMFFTFESNENKGSIAISFNLMFQEAKYQDEMVAPGICISQHETGKTNMEELIGCSYTVENIEEANEREDSFYIYEHEPLEKYTFTILEISGKRVHIQLEGTAVVDGYANPYTTADFSGYFWLCYK